MACVAKQPQRTNLRSLREIYHQRYLQEETTLFLISDSLWICQRLMNNEKVRIKNYDLSIALTGKARKTKLFHLIHYSNNNTVELCLLV